MSRRQGSGGFSDRARSTISASAPDFVKKISSALGARLCRRARESLETGAGDRVVKDLAAGVVRIVPGGFHVNGFGREVEHKAGFRLVGMQVFCVADEILPDGRGQIEGVPRGDLQDVDEIKPQPVNGDAERSVVADMTVNKQHATPAAVDCPGRDITQCMDESLVKERKRSRPFFRVPDGNREWDRRQHGDPVFGEAQSHAAVAMTVSVLIGRRGPCCSVAPMGNSRKSCPAACNSWICVQDSRSNRTGEVNDMSSRIVF